MDLFIKKFLKQQGIEAVNGVDYTLRDDGDGIYIEQWNLEVAKPELTEVDKLENDLLVQQEIKINQCKSYLNNTDWQIIRLLDPTSGEFLQESVAENRALARSLQNDIAACTTLEELNAININFS